MAIADLIDDRIIYRDLQPVDRSLPGLEQLRVEVGLISNAWPRKRDADYARIMLKIVQHAQQQRGELPLQLFLVLGDTDNDRWLTTHLRTVTGLPTLGCIAEDDHGQPETYTWQDDTCTATRWSLLECWLEDVERRIAAQKAEIPYNRVVLLVDIDKTLLGPRGRSSDEIDEARAESALQVALSVPGVPIDRSHFFTIYQALCCREYHTVTHDNHDYTAYITLLVVRNLLTLQELRRGIINGTFERFSALLRFVTPRLMPELVSLHSEISGKVLDGDLTPFKAFRHAEFAATVSRMQDGRLTLCREVGAVVHKLRDRGVLCFAASDKPAEASMPTEEQAARGMQPLHRTRARLG